MPETFNKYGRYIGAPFPFEYFVADTPPATNGDFIAIEDCETYREVEEREREELDRFDGRPSLLATIFFLMIAVCVAVVVGTAAKFWL